jgi:hypothetical protein
MHMPRGPRAAVHDPRRSPRAATADELCAALVGVTIDAALTAAVSERAPRSRRR